MQNALLHALLLAAVRAQRCTTLNGTGLTGGTLLGKPTCHLKAFDCCARCHQQQHAGCKFAVFSSLSVSLSCLSLSVSSIG